MNVDSLGEPLFQFEPATANTDTRMPRKVQEYDQRERWPTVRQETKISKQSEVNWPPMWIVQREQRVQRWARTGKLLQYEGGQGRQAPCRGKCGASMPVRPHPGRRSPTACAGRADRDVHKQTCTLELHISLNGQRYNCALLIRLRRSLARYCSFLSSRPKTISRLKQSSCPPSWVAPLEWTFSRLPRSSTPSLHWTNTGTPASNGPGKALLAKQADRPPGKSGFARTLAPIKEGGQHVSQSL